MWISEKTYKEWIKQRDYAIQTNKNNLDTIKQLTNNQVPFSTYYAERLEWWKKQFDKEPTKHYVLIKYGDGKQAGYCSSILKEAKNRLEEWNDERTVTKQIRIICDEKSDVPGTEIIIPAERITHIELLPGHPDLYSDSEIEAWAKEQLDEEMQGWKVVKEEKTWPWPIYGKSPLAEMADLFQSVFTKKMAAEYKQRHGILTDISGD